MPQGFYTKQVVITQEMVHAFGSAVGDLNPIHFDEVYAATTRFKHPIAHGALIGGLISGMLVEAYGEGTIYVSTSLQFHAPVYIGTTVELRLKTRSMDGKPKGSFQGVDIEVVDFDNDRTVVTGLAEIIPGRKV